MGSERDVERILRIQQLSAEALDALPDATQRALLYAAGVPREGLATATAALGIDDLRVWASAEAAGAITVSAGRDLAAVSAHRAWYLASAATGPDKSVTADLYKAAGPCDRFAAARAPERARTSRPTDACATRPKAR